MIIIIIIIIIVIVIIIIIIIILTIWCRRLIGTVQRYQEVYVHYYLTVCPDHCTL